jgi:hypothetical protein
VLACAKRKNMQMFIRAIVVGNVATRQFGTYCQALLLGISEGSLLSASQAALPDCSAVLYFRQPRHFHRFFFP